MAGERRGEERRGEERRRRGDMLDVGGSKPMSNSFMGVDVQNWFIKDKLQAVGDSWTCSVKSWRLKDFNTGTSCKIWRNSPGAAERRLVEEEVPEWHVCSAAASESGADQLYDSECGEAEASRPMWDGVKAEMCGLDQPP
ncbi:unnamed protein product [Pleuronectes platessa]|uniref:Uncharacterized protein n=1 Tax=Pleuronectes platessa TaxID=8262 RepID=A0A9N7U9P1_PLEPL|nr:unnamed protein product [Pleuronectes platessa]